MSIGLVFLNVELLGNIDEDVIPKNSPPAKKEHQTFSCLCHIFSHKYF